jgi:ATP-dependent DNA helicase RecG
MAPGADQGKKSPLALSLQYLKGVGPSRVRVFEKLGFRTLADLMHLFPRRYEDRSKRVAVADLEGGEKRLAEGTVAEKRLIRTRRGPPLFRILLEDGTGTLTALWFHSAYLDRTFEPGQKVALYGRPEREGSGLRMIHPDYEILDRADGRRIHTGRIVPVYPTTQDLPQRSLRNLQYELLVRHLREVADPLPAAIREKHRLVNKIFAMKCIHFPGSLDDLDKAYRRLVFDEFFFIQLALGLARRKRVPAAPHEGLVVHAGLLEEFASLLPFDLTDGQRKAMGDVLSDLAGPAPLHRLVQGDVGSGKTMVAAFALYVVARSGAQGALMAPTEILAQQHYLTLARLFSRAGIGVAFLAQGQSARERRRVVGSLKDGRTPIVVGTHALIQEGVGFRDLKMAVVDEQHKFGILQRRFLQEKAAAPNLLVLTATPIPRTLALTLYGDLDLSVMQDRPRGRGAIETVWVGEERREDVWRTVEEELRKGRQAYVVHPTVSAGGAAALRDATRAHAAVSARFRGFAAELLHGRMSADRKAEIMRRFQANQTRVLVTTTVVEVGLDVPNATVLVVENAERFGLSQLHQLRGRIGRGAHGSICILISDSENALTADRLRALEELDSGFDVAEEDLRLRGPGDFFGLRQHGIPQLRIGDLVKDVSLLEAARERALEVLRRDAGLARPEHGGLKAELHRRSARCARFGDA